MRIESHSAFKAGLLMLLAFVLLTCLMGQCDVQAIGPQGSCVGFASINGAVASKLGYNESFYKISKYLGYATLAAAALLALGSVISAVGNRSNLGGAVSLILLFVVTFIAYVAFEKLIINYRPVLLDGELEASYPSSHTLLAISVWGAAAYWFGTKLKNRGIRFILVLLSVVLMLAVPASRLLSGVHWLTDIIAGVLVGSAFLHFYIAATPKKR